MLRRELRKLEELVKRVVRMEVRREERVVRYWGERRDYRESRARS